MLTKMKDVLNLLLFHFPLFLHMVPCHLFKLMVVEKEELKRKKLKNRCGFNSVDGFTNKNIVKMPAWVSLLMQIFSLTNESLDSYQWVQEEHQGRKKGKRKLVESKEEYLEVSSAGRH